MVDFQATIDAIAEAESLEALSSLFKDLCASLGLSHMVYHGVSAPGRGLETPVLLLTYEQSWVSRYFSERYFEIDPIVVEGRSAFLPLDWSDVPRPTSRVVDFFKDSERHGVGRQGVTIPIRGPRGERALFTLNSTASSKEWADIRRKNMPQFHILGHFIHARAMSFGNAEPISVPKLSLRERQCLRLSAEGKLYKVIAYDLGLSESAVNLYLKSARHKLNAATLPQAVAKALAYDLIELT